MAASRRARKTTTWGRGAAVVAALGLLGAGCAASTTTSPVTGGEAGSTAPANASTTAGGAPGTTAPPTSTAAFPKAEWDTVDPAAAGFDKAGLDEMAKAAEANGSNCLLVTRHGKLVTESYWNGKDANSAQEVFSATKSYTSTLVGIAQGEGKLDIDDSASKYIPEWKGTPAEAVTVKNLISNDSGRHWDFQTDYFAMAAGAADKDKFTIDLAQDDPPGKVWVYNNSAIQTLDAVLKKATGEDTAAYAKEKLLGPIGMAHSEMTKDPAGNTLTFMGLHSTCRDMARFGYLALNKGEWDGQQVVPKGWIDEATKPSQKLNSSYGYLWWLNTVGPRPASGVGATSAESEANPDQGPMVKGAKENVFWALGLGNQIIAIYPDTGVVAVRLGPANPPKDAPKFGTAELTLGTQKALVKP